MQLHQTKQTYLPPTSSELALSMLAGYRLQVRLKKLTVTFWALVFLLCVSGAGVHPQELPQGSNARQSPQSRPVLRATTRLVQVNVIVRDKRGNPVEELQPEDFTVFDEGQPQKIAVFSLESSSAGTRAAGGALPPDRPSNVFTNRLERTGPLRPSVTIVLFDALNTPINDQAYARNRIIQFLGTLHPEDHAAIYLLTTKLQVLHEFTQDTKELLAALEHFHGRSSAFLAPANSSSTDPSAVAPDLSDALDSIQRGAMSNVPPALAQLLKNADGAMMDSENVNRAQITAAALEAIAGHLARIPGRKSIVWVSGSFPIQIGYGAGTLMNLAREQRSFAPELEHAAEVLDQAGIAVYPVDARGLRSGAIPPERGPKPPRSFAPGHNDNEFFTMDLLADRTGGKAFYNNNNLVGAMRTALADGESSYMIGFYPAHGKWDGKFHELRIKVRAHGDEVRYRKGYFAFPEPTGEKKQREEKETLDAAIWSPIESTAIGIEVNVQGSPTAADRTLALSLGMDIKEILLEEKEGLWRGNIELMFFQMGQDGKTLDGETKLVTLNLDGQKYKSLQENGLFIVRHLPILPAANTLRIVVRDRGSSAIGTVTVPINQWFSPEAAKSGGLGSPSNSPEQ